MQVQVQVQAQERVRVQGQTKRGLLVQAAPPPHACGGVRRLSGRAQCRAAAVLQLAVARLTTTMRLCTMFRHMVQSRLQRASRRLQPQLMMMAALAVAVLLQLVRLMMMAMHTRAAMPHLSARTLALTAA